MKNKTEIIAWFKTRNKLIIVSVLGLIIILGATRVFIFKAGSGRTDPGYNSLSLILPRANPLQDSTWDKLKFYEKSDEDSIKSRQRQYDNLNLELENSTYYKNRYDDNFINFFPKEKKLEAIYEDTGATALLGTNNTTEGKVYNKLKQLDLAMEEAKSNGAAQHSPRLSPLAKPSQISSPSIEAIAKLNRDVDGTGDPEMRQIDGMLEKILDIQHPDRVNQRLKEESQQNASHVYPLSVKDNKTVISLLGSTENKYEEPGIPLKTREESTFLSVGRIPENLPLQRSIKAEVEEAQSIVSGSTVKMKLLDNVLINGQAISKGQLVYGKCSITGDRLEIEITSIHCNGQLLPVQLIVYDIDGLKGIHVPGSIARDAVKQSTDQAIQGFNIPSLDPSIGAQAASAGIQAAKSLIGKKAKLVRVSIKPGYVVLLKNVD